MGLFEDISSWSRKNSGPFTVILVISLILSSLVLWATHTFDGGQLALISSPLSPPWTFITYPWAWMPYGSGLSLMCFAFLIIWLLQAGGSVEREMGTPRFIGLWFISTLLAGIFMVFGAKLFQLKVGVIAPYLPESAVTVVWCVRNRTSVVMLYGFLPVSGFWMGWATAVIVLLLYGAGAVPLGFCACIHLGIAALFAADRLPGLAYEAAGGAKPWSWSKRDKKEATTRGQVQYDQSYFDEVKRREQDRAERERLRKLFGDDEPPA